MTKKRTYNDVCGLAHAMELVGERWALLVLRELAFGPKRFTDIRTGLPSASPNVLSQRLRELEAVGVLRRRKLAPPAGSWVYELTDWGQELGPTLRAFGRWAARSPVFPDHGHFSSDAMAMSMETMFDPQAAKGVTGLIEVAFGEDRFHVEVADGQISVGRAGAHEPSAVIETTPEAWVGVIYADREVADAEAAGELRITGDRAQAVALTGFFALPEPVVLEAAPA
ncbi:MAG: winged helix-turn-helix transcriptional regulator [Solirubrobacterales bacterium]